MITEALLPSLLLHPPPKPAPLAHVQAFPSFPLHGPRSTAEYEAGVGGLPLHNILISYEAEPCPRIRALENLLPVPSLGLHSGKTETLRASVSSSRVEGGIDHLYPWIVHSEIS